MPGFKERLSKRQEEKKARRKARATDPRKPARRSRIDDVEAHETEMWLGPRKSD